MVLLAVSLFMWGPLSAPIHEQLGMIFAVVLWLDQWFCFLSQMAMLQFISSGLPKVLRIVTCFWLCIIAVCNMLSCTELHRKLSKMECASSCTVHSRRPHKQQYLHQLKTVLFNSGGCSQYNPLWSLDWGQNWRNWRFGASKGSQWRGV